MSSYKRILFIFLLIAVFVGIDIAFGDYLAAPLIVVIGLAIFIIGWLWLEGKQAKNFIEWLRQGANRADYNQYQFTGIWKELGDYTERLLRLREQENKQSIERLNRLLSAIQVSPNGVLLLDEEYRIEWCNATVTEHFGLDQQRDLGQHITNLVRVPEFIAYLEEKDYKKPLKLHHCNGKGHLSIQLHPYDKDRLLLLSNDITQIEQAEKMRRDFVADVSHEMRTPLTVLSGFIETMQNLPLNDEERGRYLALMSQQSARMQSLINDLLVLARLEGSPPPPNDQWVEVRSMMKHIENTVRELSAGRHQIVFNGLEQLEIAGIASEIMSAVSNIAINAVRYSREGDSITVTSQYLDNGDVCFQVKDTGQGIPKEHIAHLTQRFYRIDRSRSRETGGTGLGLSIVKHILLRHGGRLTIDSIEGKGSTFSLYFPANRVRQIDTPQS